MIDPIWLWWLAALIGIGGSAIFSGMETGSYRLNRVRLAVREHHGDPAARRLHRLTSDRPRLLATLLIGNNLANYLGTAALGVIFASWQWSDAKVVIVNAMVVTPLLFVFGETLPKDLFAAHADRLMYVMSRPLAVSRAVFAWMGLTPLVRVVSHVLIRALGDRPDDTPLHPRRVFGSLVREGAGDGLLTEDQIALAERVLALADHQVGSEMIPWAQVKRLPSSITPQALHEAAMTSHFTRLPVIDQQQRVCGIVHIDHVLRTGSPEPAALDAVMFQPLTVTPNTPIRVALTRMQQARAAMAIVIDGAQKPVGVVTVKDLVEPITGELTEW